MSTCSVPVSFFFKSNITVHISCLFLFYFSFVVSFFIYFIKSSVQSPVSRVQSPESRVQSPESRVQSPGSRVQGPGSSPDFILCPAHFYNEIINNYDISFQEKLGGGNLRPHKDKTRTRLENNQGGVMGGGGTK